VSGNFSKQISRDDVLEFGNCGVFAVADVIFAVDDNAVMFRAAKRVYETFLLVNRPTSMRAYIFF